MNRAVLLPAVWLVDQLAGDPEWLPHPVRLVGFVTTHTEAVIRRSDRSNLYDLLAGATMTIAIVATTFVVTDRAIRFARRNSPVLGNVVELLLGWTCIAARNLEQETSRVTDAVCKGDLVHARSQLARIVGRDTDHLDEQEICRALVETLAESACDGIVAPIFYLALGGVPLAMAYKAVNTLDSMIGHADERYFYFGKAAARLDDAANHLPSRLSAAAIVSASALDAQTDFRAALRTWQRDGGMHRSPNAGHPESAMAGALHARLGGGNTYAGELIETSLMGAEFSPPGPPQVKRASRLVSMATVLGIAAASALLLTRKWLR